MSGARPGRGGRDVAGSATAGTGGTSDSSETAGDADLFPGHHGHGRAFRPRTGHLGHRLTCGAAPGRGTRGRSPFPDDAALEITSGPFEWVPGRAGELSGPYPCAGADRPHLTPPGRTKASTARLAKAPPRRPSSPPAGAARRRPWNRRWRRAFGGGLRGLDARPVSGTIKSSPTPGPTRRGGGRAPC
jgi:hypothetical protein